MKPTRILRRAMCALSRKRRWSPPMAVWPIWRISSAKGRRYLAAGGMMLLEHGWTQGEAVRAIFRAAGYGDIATCRDYGDNERLTLGQYQGGV